MADPKQPSSHTESKPVKKMEEEVEELESPAPTCIEGPGGEAYGYAHTTPDIPEPQPSLISHPGSEPPLPPDEPEPEPQ
jgi:hypothetical protein